MAQYSDTNDTSIVLRIDYGSTSFLLTGDMEKTAETDLVNSGANLKGRCAAGGPPRFQHLHRLAFLNAVLPEMGIISCGVNNKYGHPARGDAEHPAGRRGGRVPHRPAGHHHHWQRRPELHRGHRALCRDAELNPTDPAAASTAQQAYIGNVNSKKFHLPTCPNLPAEKNQILFSSYDEAIAAGYTPLLQLHQIRVLPQSNPSGLPAPSEMEPSDGTGMFPVESGTFPDRQGPLPEGAGTA